MECKCSLIKRRIVNDKRITIFELYFCTDCFNTHIPEYTCCHNPNVTKIHTEYSNNTIHKRDFCLNCYKIWNNYKKTSNERLLLLNKERTLKARELYNSYYDMLQQCNSHYRKKHYELKRQFEISEWRLNYESYINSDEWKEKRKNILIRDNYICQICKTNKAVQVHHLTYKRLGNEQDFDLISVCLPCHELEHTKQ
jgi:hypothetical protein